EEAPFTLTGEQKESFSKALLKAFPSSTSLDGMTRSRLGIPLTEYSSPAPLPTIVLDLMAWADAQGLLRDLILAAQAAKPSSIDLEQFARSLRLPIFPRPQPPELIL